MPWCGGAQLAVPQSHQAWGLVYDPGAAFVWLNEVPVDLSRREAGTAKMRCC